MKPVRPRLAALITTAALALGGCAVTTDDVDRTGGVSTSARAVADGTGVWDATAVHEISVEAAEADLDEMFATYSSTGEKDWVTATVTIDGDTFEDAGLRLKGNSSLRGASVDSDPATLPWLIRLDKFVDDASLDGSSEFVVRSNSTETSLNEALALDLLAKAGLASEHAVATSFSVNGTDAQLRLVVQNLDEDWEEENFSGAGLLYKSESGGDWSWRGEDPAAYEDVFDQETGDEDDMTPLIDFLDFVNNSTDEELEAGLASRLDVDAFARYLAFEDLVDNFDDIDGPGNNSFLRWDADSDAFTVVAWDHNLAFGVSNVGGDGGPGGRAGGSDGWPGGAVGAPGGERPAMPEGMEGMEGKEGERPAGPPDGGGPGGGGPGGGRSNVLVERFTSVEQWADLVDQARADLTSDLFTSGYAEEVLDQWVGVLIEQASDLVDTDTVQSEADAVRARLST